MVRSVCRVAVHADVIATAPAYDAANRLLDAIMKFFSQRGGNSEVVRFSLKQIVFERLAENHPHSGSPKISSKLRP